MDVDIRKYVIDNFKNLPKEEMKESIEESLVGKEEEILPGLGVFFELLWEGSKEEFKNQLVTIIEERIKGI